MKKIQSALALILVSVMTLALVGCGAPKATQPPAASPDASDDGKVYEFIYAGTVPDTHPMTVSFKWMAEELKTRTDGRMLMTLYPNNSLGDTRANLESMQNNSVQIGEGSSAPLAIFTSNYLPLSLPFFFKDEQQAYDFSESDFMDTLAEKTVGEIGVRPVGWFLNGARCLTNGKRAVASPSDMKGLKVRVMENDIYIKTFEALGASATPMSFAEVFTGLQQGTIDGQDNPTAIVVSNKFYEVQNYFTDLHHVIDLAPIMVSEEWYQSLPEDLRTTFDAVIAETVAMERKLMAESIASDMETISSNCEVTILTDEQRQVFKEQCASVYDWFASQYSDIDVQSYLDAASAN